MKYTLVTLSCPRGHAAELSFEVPHTRITELDDQATASDTTLEALIRDDLLQGYGQCPTCDTRYKVEIGSTVDSDDHGRVNTGP